MSEETNPKGRLMALNSLEHNPGWAVYCARQKEVMGQSIDAKVFDPKTPADEREMLVRARQFLVENHTPEKILKTLLTSLEGEVNRAEKERERTGKT